MAFGQDLFGDAIVCLMVVVSTKCHEACDIVVVNEHELIAGLRGEMLWRDGVLRDVYRASKAYLSALDSFGRVGLLRLKVATRCNVYNYKNCCAYYNNSPEEYGYYFLHIIHYT